MAILPYKYDDGHHDPWEMLPVSASLTAALGTGMVLSSGKLAIAGATAVPEYILMRSIAGLEAGTLVPVIRVSADTEYETTLSVASASIAIGAKYTTTGASDTKITATSTSGVAEVTGFDGTAAGSKVRVRFK